ncbi:MAG: hypothetical protein ACTSU5_05030 [Promethearchaeota archaeon]
MRANGGVVLTIDGMAPLRGRQGLHIVHDYFTGQTLGAKKLPNQRQDTIAEFLQTIEKGLEAELGVPVLAIVSDALPSQRLAIGRVFPGVPHCLCHFHFFNLVLLAPNALDSHVVTQVRATLRGLRYSQRYKGVARARQLAPAPQGPVFHEPRARLARGGLAGRPRALMKFVRTKGEHLFNYKRVPGAPTTNNSHELQYKQLEHLLRRANGHSAANEYLLARGERLVFVNPGEAFEDIDAILQGVD